MANKTFKVEFGDYQMELVQCEVFYRKWNDDRGCYELVKARSVNNTFGSQELVKEAKQHAERMGIEEVRAAETGSAI